MQSEVKQCEIGEMVIRMSHVFQDMITSFQDLNLVECSFIHCRRILENGDLEEGEGNGVLRDCITAFWSVFYETTCGGVDCKIPLLQQHLGERQWESIARILITGLKLKYTPAKLSRVFLELCFRPDTTTPSEDKLLRDFLLFLSIPDRELVKLSMDDLSDVDENDYLDFLTEHEVRCIPKQDQVRNVVLAIAHKELVQEPMFIIQIFQQVLSQYKETLYVSSDSDVFNW